MIEGVKALAVKPNNPQFDTQERSDCCELVSDPTPQGINNSDNKKPKDPNSNLDEQRQEGRHKLRAGP